MQQGRVQARYRGVFPVAPTTFDDRGELDLDSQRRCIDFMIDAGSNGLCILANFSEQFALGDDERDTLIDVILAHVAERDQVALRILAMGLDTAGPTGQLMVNLLGAIAEFERSLMLERQREGIAEAKRRGKYRGRAPTARAKAGEVAKLRGQGLGAAKIAERLKISRASVYRVLADTATPEPPAA